VLPDAGRGRPVDTDGSVAGEALFFEMCGCRGEWRGCFSWHSPGTIQMNSELAASTILACFCTGGQLSLPFKHGLAAHRSSN
jgi:hypothetical protein